MYIKLRKALYGCLKSALLFYKKLLGNLTSIRFKTNKYDPCVANATVTGKQMTVCWHVGDLKISHMEDEMIIKLIKWPETKYGKMKLSRGA